MPNRAARNARFSGRKAYRSFRSPSSPVRSNCSQLGFDIVPRRLSRLDHSNRSLLWADEPPDWTTASPRGNMAAAHFAEHSGSP